MPKFILDKGDGADWFDSLDQFTQGYVEAMFFTSTGTGDDADLEDANVGEIADETRDAIKQDCDAFKASVRKSWLAFGRKYGATWRRGETEFGHDFWYTRNGHGVGFWEPDRWPEGYGDHWDKAAKTYPSIDLYRGDDGKLYLA